MRWNFDFIGASRWFFSISGVILAIGAIAFATKQLNLGIDFESGTRITVEPRGAGRRPRRCARRSSTPTSTAPTAAEIQETESTEGSDFGDNVLQIQAKIPPDQIGDAQEALDEEFGLEGGSEGFDSQSIGPTFGEQVARSAMIAIIFSLLVISAYVAIRFEAKYAVPVLIALVHDILITARRLRAGRAGGDERDGRGLPDHPRLLDVRHGDRARPHPRERAADAARGLLADRQPLDERGAHAVADHRPLDRVPDRRAARLRRRDAARLRLRDDGRSRLRYLLVDLHRLAGADALEGARARLPQPPGADHRGDGLRARPSRRRTSSPRSTRPSATRCARGRRRRRAPAGPAGAVAPLPPRPRWRWPTPPVERRRPRRERGVERRGPRPEPAERRARARPSERRSSEGAEKRERASAARQQQRKRKHGRNR